MHIVQNLKVSFLVLNSRVNKNKEVPIYCRIALNSQHKRFATGILAPINHWNQEKQRIKGTSTLSISINAKVTEVKNKVLAIELQFIKEGEEFTIDDVINKLTGKSSGSFKTLKDVFTYKLEQMELMKGKEYAATTIEKNIQMQRVVETYLKDKLLVSDILLNKVDTKFLSEFEFYLRSERKLAVASSNKIIQKLKAIMNLAFEFGAIQKPAFPNHKFKHEKPKVVYLTMDELSQLEHYKFAQEVLNKVRDIFLFSVYTGLHYMDAMSLRNSNIIKGVDGKFWICYTRSKTDTEIHIPILERTQQLILLFKNKYGVMDEIVPRFSNQKINSYLKEIAEIANIKKSLSHKVARKTFGSVLLFYNVPMKVVSKLMGHSSVVITERHYAQVELKKLGHEMDMVNLLLNEK